MKKQKIKQKKQKLSDTVNSDTACISSSIPHHITHGIIAVFATAIAIFLVIAGFNGGGILGNWLYTNLIYLLGFGYILLPMSLLFVTVSALRSFDHKFGWLQVIGSVLFFISSLALFETIITNAGGRLGNMISYPIISLVDTVGAVLFLLAFIITSLVIAFDVHLAAIASHTIARIRSRHDNIDSMNAETMPDISMPEKPITQEIMPKMPVNTDTEPTSKNSKETAPRIASSDNSDADFVVPKVMSNTRYDTPPISLLASNRGKPQTGDVKANINIIKRTLANFGIIVEMDEACPGSSVTRYALKPAEGVRLNKILSLQSNLELALAASPVRIEAPIPGKSLVGVEVPNISRSTLGLGPLLSESEFALSNKPLQMTLGRSITGTAHFADLAKMPHLLVAGTTGSGKSVTIHNFIVSLLFRNGPDKLKFIMVDPKRVELTLYNNIPHLMTPVITDAKKALKALKWLAEEMNRRYDILQSHKVRDIQSYHSTILASYTKKMGKSPTESGSENAPPPMPYIVLIIDELADIMQTYPRELEGGIVRLAQMSRAVGIHLILSTQRPSVKVITGLIKANIPARVALQVASQIDSRTILDMTGAEKLLGAGDMLFLSGEMAKPRRIQSAFLSEEEVKKVVSWIIDKNDTIIPDQINFESNQDRANDPIFSSNAESDKSENNEEDDEMYEEAKKMIIESRTASTSYLQRRLGLGYGRAARIIDTLEMRGIISKPNNQKRRDVLAPNPNAHEAMLVENTVQTENSPE